MAEENEPVTSPAGPGQQPPASPQLAAVEAAIAGKAAPNAEGPESVLPKQGDDFLTGDVTVDWGGGTKRTVPIETLIEAAKAKESIEQRAQAIKDQLSELGTYQQLGNLIEGMDDAQRAQLRKLFEDPTLLTKMSNGHESNGSDDFGMQPQSAQKDPALTKLSQELAELRQYVQADLVQKRSHSLAERVQQEMNSYPVFSETPAKDGERLIKSSIMNAIAADPNANVERIVATHAADLHKMFSTSRKGVVQEARGGSPSPMTPNIPEGWKPKAEDLNSGKILRHALDQINQIQV